MFISRWLVIQYQQKFNQNENNLLLKFVFSKVSNITYRAKSSKKNKLHPFFKSVSQRIPSRGLTYPTWGKGKSSSKCHFGGIC